MSLINDALKRASKPRPPASNPSVIPPMRPADRPPVKGLPKFFLPISLTIFAAAIWILLKGVQTQQALNAAGGPVSVAAREGQPIPPPPDLLKEISKEHKEFRPIAEKFLRNELTPAKPEGQPVFVIPEAPPPPEHIFVPTTPAPHPSPPVAHPHPATTPPPSVQPQAHFAAISQPAYKLGGIIYRASNPAAVVNNKTVYAGDRVGKARVKSIQKDGVVLQLPDGKLLELLLD